MHGTYLSTARKIISKHFSILLDEKDIRPVKSGMTNVSFFFEIGKDAYILRLNGEGTEKLINRKHEAETYRLIRPFRISEEIVSIDVDAGYKLSRFIENARVCNPHDKGDVQLCMDTLRSFHALKLQCNYEFDIFQQLELYESLWKKHHEHSCYFDYDETKHSVLQLTSLLGKDRQKERCLSHMDAVSDNFLIGNDSRVYMLDWEYAGMCDPDADIAMFSIYAGYRKEQADELIDMYYSEGCKDEVRLRIYGYIAAGGLLWSNWCEYKSTLGVRFGSYANRQYEYARDFSMLTLSFLR